MNKRGFACFIFLLLLCSSSAFAEPHLWAAHNTIVDMGLNGEFNVSADLTTARFFCVTLEAADDGDVPELNVNLNDRNTIPKFTLSGGDYTYWNGDGLKTVSGTAQQFDMARSDTVMYNNGSTLIGSDNLGYTPTGDGGDWVHFFFEADTGLNSVDVSWEGPNAGRGKVPEFKSTKEQLEGIVPYIEYYWSDDDVMSTTRYIPGFNWRFVRSDDVTKAVSADVDITVSIRYTGGSLEFWDDPNAQALGANLKNGLDPVTIKAGEILEGKVEFPNLGKDAYGVPIADTSLTILRYYIEDKKDECYQWRFVPSSSLEPQMELSLWYKISVPLINGQPDYKYARYTNTEISFENSWGVYFEPNYCDIGKFVIEGGNYTIIDNNGVPVNEELPYIPLVQVRIPGPGTASPAYNLMMQDNLRPVDWDYHNGRYWGRRFSFVDETGDSLSGKKFSWTFSDELAKRMNGGGTVPEYKSVSEQLSETGFFPYIELVYDDDEMITAIKYRFAQSPDVDAIYTPEMFSTIGLGLEGVVDENGEGLWLGWAPDFGTCIDDGTKAVYESHEWTLEKRVKPGSGFSLSAEVTTFPSVNNTWDDWVTWIENGGDSNTGIKYVWNFNNDVPSSQVSLIDDDEAGGILGNIAETLNEGGVFAVQREEVSKESGITDEVEAAVASKDAELVGRFNQLNIMESGTYAIKVTLPDELYDDIEGAASADLVVYAMTNDENNGGNDFPGETSGDYGVPGEVSGDHNVPEETSGDNSVPGEVSGDRVGVSAAGFFTFYAADGEDDNASISESGRLLASDGKTFNSVDAKEFILTVNLKAAADQNYTNYKLYLGRKKNDSQKQEDTPSADTTSDDNKPADTTSDDNKPADNTSDDAKPADTMSDDNKPADTASDDAKPENNTSVDTTPTNTTTQNNPYTVNTPSNNVPQNTRNTDDTPQDTSTEDNTPADTQPEDNTPADNVPQDNAPEDNTPADNSPEDNVPEDNTPEDNNPDDNSPEDNTPADNVIEEIMENILRDEAGSVDDTTKNSIQALVGGEYEMMSLLDAAESGRITGYAPQNEQPDEETMQAISDRFTDSELVCLLPAFTLNTDEPVIIVLKIEVDDVNNLPLHFFKMQGSEISTSSVNFVQASDAVDNSEDEDAVFTDGTNRITTLSSNKVYVTSVFDKGSYAPLVVTGTAKSTPEAPDSNPVSNNENNEAGDDISSSSSGCNVSLMGAGALLLAMLQMRKKSAR